MEYVRTKTIKLESGEKQRKCISFLFAASEAGESEQRVSVSCSVETPLLLDRQFLKDEATDVTSLFP